jgi:hypothetical protein
MPQLSSGQTASLVLDPGQSYTISTTGSATVKGIYGAPATTTTLTANFATFGPYGVPAKLDIACASGVASYTLDQYEGDVVRSKSNQLTGMGAFSGPDGKPILSGGFTVKVALGIAGAQSNEQGTTLRQDSLGVWQRTSVAAPSQNIYEPVKLSVGFGSMFTLTAELLARDGVQVDLYNGAVGGSSGYLDWAGSVFMAGRGNSTAYRGKRASLGAGDPGTRGDLIYSNGATWEATTGNRHLVFYSDAANPITLGGITHFRDPGYVVKETNLVTAATPPTFPGSPVVGNTVTDGGIVWTCINVGAKVADAATIRVNRYIEDGFDPYFMCNRVRTALMASPVSPSKRYVYFQNGQSDAGIATAIYSVTLRTMAQYFGQAPYSIQSIFGLSIYYPAQSQANWDLLETALSASGLSGTPNYASSLLTTSLTSAGYNLATPGSPVPSFGFYYGQSLYRAFGTDTVSMLQPSDPHTTLDGAVLCAQALAPTLSKILRNSAT